MRYVILNQNRQKKKADRCIIEVGEKQDGAKVTAGLRAGFLLATEIPFIT